MNKKLSCFLISLLVCSCAANSLYNINYDKFKQDLSVCKTFEKEYESVSYMLCYINNIKENIEGYAITGVYQMNSPIPVNFNEAILYNGKQLKIQSEDDRRWEITINTYKIKLDENILDNVQDKLEIKIYGNSGVSYVMDLITKEDIINFKEVVSKEKQKVSNYIK